MIIDIGTRLEAPVDRVWAEVQKPKLLMHIAAPVLIFKPVGNAPIPDEFPDGRFRFWMLVFGVIPFGRQWVDVSRPELGDGIKRVRDNGCGDLIQVWDHWIEIAPTADDATAYRDRVTIKAGLLTPFVWAFAFAFYSWRQHRWRALIKRGFRY